MRIILVGPAQARKELKAALAAPGTARIEIAAEFETLHEAHAADIHAHAILSIEAAAGGGSLDRADRWIEEDLTPREIEVLELLAEGLPNKAIGERLGISDQTVKVHVASICAKLDVSNRTAAVRRALRRGVIGL